MSEFEGARRNFLRRGVEEEKLSQLTAPGRF